MAKNWAESRGRQTQFNAFDPGGLTSPAIILTLS